MKSLNGMKSKRAPKVGLFRIAFVRFGFPPKSQSTKLNWTVLDTTIDTEDCCLLFWAAGRYLAVEPNTLRVSVQLTPERSQNVARILVGT